MVSLGLVTSAVIASYSCHLCLDVLFFVFVQARTASQELLGLRKPILVDCVFWSGIQLPSGGDARQSEMLFFAPFSPPAVFPSDICGTYPQSCEIEEQSKNNI